MTQHIQHLTERKKQPADAVERYVVIDFETTGLDMEEDKIIEFGAVRVVGGQVEETFSTLVCCEKPVPKDVEQLTGITSAMLQKEGIPEKEALRKFLEFCGNDDLVGYHIRFDLEFLRRACKHNGISPINRKAIDVLRLFKKKIHSYSGYTLKATAEQLGIQCDTVHRAEADCLLTYRIFEKLKEIQ